MRLRDWYSRQGPVGRRLLLLLMVVLLLAGGVGGLWFTPTGHYITAPGGAVDTSRLVEVKGGLPHSDNLYMLWVTSQPANLLLYLYARVDGRAELETREQFLGEIEDYDKYVELTRRMMQDSQQTAKAIALQQLGYGRGVQIDGAEVTDLTGESPSKGFIQPGDVIIAVAGASVRNSAELSAILKQQRAGEALEVRVRRDGQEVSFTSPTGEHPNPDRKGTAAFGIFIKDHLVFDIPIPVTFESGAITGPSAGLMFTLQIMDQLTPGGLAPGIVVAGTGTIEADGSVGGIGGVRQKVFTAEAAGASVMFVPVANYEAAAAVATRIEVVPVSHVRDALAWLRAHAAKRAEAGHSSPAFWS